MRRINAEHKPNVFSWFVLLGLALFSAACNERTPGCLDIQAENFNFAAETDDPSLCRYPDLVLRVSYRWDTTAFQTSKLYANDAGDSIAIHGVQVLFSHFVIESAAEGPLTIVDEVNLVEGDCASNASMPVPDDFVFADRSALGFPVGGFRESGTMVSCSFSTGLPSAYLPTCPDRLPASHPLRSARAGYRMAQGDFALGRFVVSQDSVAAKRDTFFCYASPKELSFPLGRDFKRGEKDTLFMEINFAPILSPIDWEQPKDTISGRIARNVAGALFLY